MSGALRSLRKMNRNDNVEATIKALNAGCGFKQHNVQFLITGPNPHPTEPAQLISILDLGSAVLHHHQDSPDEVLEDILSAIDVMQTHLQNVKEQITDHITNPIEGTDNG